MYTVSKYLKATVFGETYSLTHTHALAILNWLWTKIIYYAKTYWFAEWLGTHIYILQNPDFVKEDIEVQILSIFTEQVHRTMGGWQLFQFK
jgi:hypothetical protein